jgi:hypothetical protein
MPSRHILILGQAPSDGSGTGAFISSNVGLTANTSYYVRAYATNAAGTAYGLNVSFTTLALMSDFQITTGSGGSYSAVATAGARAVYNLAVTGIGSFSGSVTFSCSGLPTAAACSVNPNPLSVSGSSAAPFSAAITTTARTTAGIPKSLHQFPCGGVGPAAVLCLGGLAMIVCMSRRRRISIAFLMLCAIGLAGCCGGKKTTSTQGTPTGTYSVVLTATSGSINHNANLTLIVQ